MTLPTISAPRTRHHADLAWWCDVYNDFAKRLTPTRTVQGARRGATTRPRQRTSQEPLILEVASAHLTQHSGTLTGRYLAALAATTAAVDAAQNPRKGASVWHILLSTGFLSLTALLILSLTGAGGSAMLVASVIAIVCTVLGFPLARWSVTRQHAAFHQAMFDATRIAGPSAARAYADSGAHLHRTVVHNLLTGQPLTPRAYRTAILTSITAEDQVQPHD